MRGREEIRQGLSWGLNSLEKPGFSVRQIWVDGDSAVVELDTHHRFKGGIEVKFDQVFVVESRDGKICRLQSYVPYSPPGIGGLIPRLTRAAWNLRDLARATAERLRIGKPRPGPAKPAH